MVHDDYVTMVDHGQCGMRIVNAGAPLCWSTRGAVPMGITGCRFHSHAVTLPLILDEQSFTCDFKNDAGDNSNPAPSGEPVHGCDSLSTVQASRLTTGPKWAENRFFKPTHSIK